MRLKVSAASANDELLGLVTEGYRVLQTIRDDYASKRNAGVFNEERDVKAYTEALNAWATTVMAALRGIFPTELEPYTFRHPDVPLGSAVGVNYKIEGVAKKLLALVKGLDGIRRERIPEYTDLPPQERIYVEDIESFRKVRDVNPALVENVLNKGYLDLAEETIQIGLEAILNETMHKKDWGGEGNDLYTGNLILQGQRVETAFVLKGHGLRKPVLEIGDCGKNGDQLVRLMDAPARLFVVQFVGNISETVIKDMEGKVRAARAGGRQAWYCIMNGQDTARLLRAYAKI